MSDRTKYFDDARTWATDVRLSEGRQRRTAWIVAGLAASVGLVEAMALVLLMPLKTVQTVTVLVDRQTGYVQALDPLQPRRVSADAALTQSYLAQYVVAREGFDRATVGSDYRRVALWSAGLARKQYLSSMPASNPESPFKRVPSGALVLARVKSVSPLASGVALVRFETGSQDRAGDLGPRQPWVAVVRYRYSDGAMSFEDRLVNPLGFQVTSYRRDAEAPAAATLAASDMDRPIPATSRLRPTSLPDPVRNAESSAVRPSDLSRRSIPASNVPWGSPLVGIPADAGTYAMAGRP